jgi:hypothetical protein
VSRHHFQLKQQEMTHQLQKSRIRGGFHLKVFVTLSVMRLVQAAARCLLNKK